VDDGTHFQKGLWIEHLAIQPEGPAEVSPAPGVELAQDGIYIRGVWQAFLSDVRVEGLSGTGIRGGGREAAVGGKLGPRGVTTGRH
jgi:hypothetical protein